MPKIKSRGKTKEQLEEDLRKTREELAIQKWGLQKTLEGMKALVRALAKELLKKKEVVAIQKWGIEKTEKGMKVLVKELIQKKKEIEEAKAKDEAMLASIGDGLVVVDNDMEIMLINRTAEAFTGWMGQEVLGKVWEDVIALATEDGKPVPPEARPLFLAIHKEKMTTATYLYTRKDKTKFPVTITVSPVKVGSKLIGAILVFRDVTREREVDKAKSEFISLASHQLKTPPTAIKLLIERLLGGKMGKFTKKQKEYFDDIHSSNQRMIDLVNALLSVSRIELGAFIIQVSEKDACAIVRNILDELKPTIDKKQLKLRTISIDMNVMLMLDEPLFRMVVDNLVTNAIHYTAEGGEIAVDCKVVSKGQVLGGKLLEENCFVVIVSDTGYGIPEVEQSRVFTKFFRVDSTREKHPDGTGLGLYIVKSILDHSGGLIWFTSRENEGSVFYVAIPMTGMRAKVGGKALIG